ncbi:MAG TPA: hypothetical protein VGJ05_10685 [Fimbriiglobus sp.]|jgi:hypothetical protein
MRISALLAVFSLPFLVGCTGLIKITGRDITCLTTREEVHKTYGEPVATSEHDGQLVEEFTTRRKIADMWETPGYSMGLAMTMGLGELWMFPRELYQTGKHVIAGQTLQFTFDNAGNVTSICRDGECAKYPSNPDK